jgi:hypothetical protein
MMDRQQRSRKDAYAVPAILFLTVIFFHLLISPDANLPPSHHFFRESLLAGNVPLWNPHAAAGTPSAAECVNGVFYPLNTLLLLLPVEKAVGAAVALHVFLAGLFMFLLLRYFRAGWKTALICAAAYMFAGACAVRFQFPVFTNGAPWLPAAILFLEIAIRRRKMTAAIAAGAMLGLQMLAGNLQTASLTFVLLALLALFRFFFNGKKGSTTRGFDFFPITALAVAVPASAVLSSAQLIRTAGLFTASHGLKLVCAPQLATFAAFAGIAAALLFVVSVMSIRPARKKPKQGLPLS